MNIKGKTVDSNLSTEQIIDLLQRLPSGFRTPATEVQKQRDQRLNTLEKTIEFKEAFKSLEDSERQKQESQQHFDVTAPYQPKEFIDKMQDSIESLEKAVGGWHKIGHHLDVLKMGAIQYQMIVMLNSSTINQAILENAQQIDEGKTDESTVIKKAETVRKNSLNFLRDRINDSYRKFAAPVDKDAHRVAQGEVGYSADKKIGADDIFESVAVILQDPITKKTAFINADQHTTYDKIEDALSPMPQGHKLKARLVGARKSDNYLLDTSAINVLGSVVTFLKEHNDIDVISADIRKSNNDFLPAVTVNPETFELDYKVPGKAGPNLKYHSAHSTFYVFEQASDFRSKNIPVDFDLTISRTRAPVLLDSVNKLNYMCYSLTFQENFMDKRLYPVSPEVFRKEVKPLIDSHYSAAGRPAKISDYQVFNAMLYILRTGNPWRDLPKCYGPWHTIYTRFKRASDRGVWWKILILLQQNKRLTMHVVMADSTTIAFHRHGGVSKGGSIAGE